MVKVTPGRELAIYQAADAFALFTGLAPSVEIMGNGFHQAMSERHAG